ncbi:unnamed protein product [Jaminaea pallidilutea]
MATPFPISLPPSETRKLSAAAREEAPSGSAYPSSHKVLRKTTQADGDAGVKILPRDGEANVLVTSALPYVNNVPHLGNIIGSTLSADVFARYSRSRNRNTLYICGTDEYGTATETKALEDGVTPQELCDKYHALHASVYKWFQIGFDHFGRTTTPAQTEITQGIFLRLEENGYMEKRTMTQLYCPKDDRFLADRYVEGICPRCDYEDARGDQCDKCGQLLDAVDLLEPRCKICSTAPVLRESPHMFIRIDTLQPQVEEWAKKSSREGGWSNNGRLITDSWFREGLRPFSVTRDLKWGVPVPKIASTEGMDGKVFYVWFDAPIGYPSITANYTEEWRQWWQNPDNVKLYQFMGKDNVRFHTVIFPSCLLGTKDPWTMLHHISTTEYLQYESGKFSKSRNVGVFGDKASSIGVPASVWRYYLLSSRPETADSHFAWREFVERNNGELLANLGNFVNRLLTFCSKKYDGILPELPQGQGLCVEQPLEESEDSVNGRFIRDVNRIVSQYVSAMEAVRLRLGLRTMMNLSARGNLFLTESGLDNNLFTNKRAECDAVMLLAVNLIWVISSLAHPFMPETADQICEQLDAPARSVPFVEDGSASGVAAVEDDDTAAASQQQQETGAIKGRALFALDLLPGHKIGKPAHLFRRIDEKQADAWRAQFGGETAAKAAALADAPSKAPSGTSKTGTGQQDGQAGLSKKQMQKLEKEKKKAAQAAKEAAQPQVRSPEMVALDQQIEAQGKVVRQAKEAAKAGAAAGDVDKEVSVLLQLKTELTDLTARVKAMEVQDTGAVN